MLWGKFLFPTIKPRNNTMKKNFFAAIIVALALTPLFGGVSLAEDNQVANATPAVTAEVKAEAPAAEKNESKTDECCTMGELKPL